MMWAANNAGSMYSFQTYSKTPLMLSMLGGIVGDAAVQHAMSDYTKAWSFKHPSPWDYINFMNHALGQDLELVLVLLAVDDRVGGRIDCGREHGGRAHDGDRAAGRPDAVAGGAQGAVRAAPVRSSSRWPTRRSWTIRPHS